MNSRVVTMPAVPYVTHSTRMSASLYPSAMRWLITSSCGARRRARTAGRTSANHIFTIGTIPFTAALAHCRGVRPRSRRVMSKGGWLKKLTSRLAIFGTGAAVRPTTSAVTSTVYSRPSSSSMSVPETSPSRRSAHASMRDVYRSTTAGAKNRATLLRCSSCAGPSEMRMGCLVKKPWGIRSAVKPAWVVCSRARST